jgi:hypothetical protein
MNMETDPTAGFEKLQYLLQQNPCPPETFGNLLLLCVRLTLLAFPLLPMFWHLARLFQFSILRSTLLREFSMKLDSIWVWVWFGWLNPCLL